MTDEARAPALRLTRRNMGLLTAGAAAAVATPALARSAAQVRSPGRTLFRGGAVLTGDPGIGNVLHGDVLVEGERIVAVQPGIKAGDAQVIDAADAIVMPGLVDAHHHFCLTAYRHALAGGSGRDLSLMVLKMLHFMRPEDTYIAALAGGLAAIDAGVTTCLDYAYVSQSREVLDGGIEGHRASGARVAYCYAETRDDSTRAMYPLPTPETRSNPPFPDDIPRLQKTYFSSRDQLMTLRLACTRDEHFVAARRAGLPMTCDGVFGVATSMRPRGYDWSRRLIDMAARGELSPDITLIHMTGAPDEVFSVVAEHGVGVTLAPITDAITRGLGDSITPIQKVLDHKMVGRTGISIDSEISSSNDLWAQLRTVFIMQRALASAKWQASGGTSAPDPMTHMDAFRLATAGGAYGLGLADRIGTLTPGKQADIIMLRNNQVSFGPLNNALASVVQAANPSNVDTVMIAGRLRKSQGRLLGVDQPAVMRRLKASRDYLARATGTWREADIVA